MRAERFGDRVAIRVVDGAELTFAAWDARANAAARGLVAAGVERGDRVGLLMPTADAVEFGIGYVAAHRAGAAAVPINPRYARREVEHILADCDPRAVLDAEGVRAIEAAGVDTAAFQVEVGPDDIADIFYTSGTTGMPRGVVSTHRNAAFHSLKPMEAGGVFLHSMPLATFTGVHGAQLTPMRLGVTSVVLPRFDAPRFAGLIETERANYVLMVPAQILLLLESGALDGTDTSSVLAVMFGGAPTPPAAVEALGGAVPNAVLLNGYGLTEGGASVCVLPPGEAKRRPGSVGKPMPGAEVGVVDDEGQPLPQGEVGEIVLKVPAGDRRYWGNEEATAQTWRGGWVHTGDLGRIDDEGYLYVVDRKKDMILRGGYNIYCVEVEDGLHEHPDIVEAAAVGVSHPVLGQDVCAVVRLRAGAPPLTVEDVRAYLADRLADYKLPRRLEVRSEPLPRTGMGKVDKKALLAELEEAT
ncbi:MAG: AMP-dependent synthetase and ligase [Acidimicrobiales bacterium]|nr:AMP-dependent synthetase and ligase [Acidimicrobiales bacterium]